MPEPFSTCNLLGARTAISPFGFPRGSQGRAAPGPAGQAERSYVPAHSIASCSGSSSLATTNRATTRTLEADTIAARRESSGREPGVPTRPRPAGRCRCPAPSWESTTRSSSLAGQSGEKVVLFKGVFQGLPWQGGWGELETSSAPRGGRGALAPCSPPPSSLMQASSR